MRILWFNWKDIKHPEAGGAEIYTHEIAERIVEKGHEITLFTSEFQGSESEDEINGVRVVRQGTILNPLNSVYRNAKKFYKKYGNRYDVVVDEINTRPFLTPKFVDKPIIALIHQLAREYWDYKMPLPLSFIGKHFLEGRWLSPYKNVKTITVSESTKRDLVEMGFNDISIVPNGIDGKPLRRVPKKEDEFTAIFVGRLTPTKMPEEAIEAFLRVGEGKLWVIGRGELEGKLRRKYESEKVVFRGFLPEEEKRELMKRSHVILVPGIREGWGRVVIEANAVGTPAIGYDIPGLRDSIKDGYNGLLCNPSPEAMAEKMMLLKDDSGLRKELSENSLKWAKNFDWGKSTEEFMNILKEVSRNG
jgi:glycosyltransferase involved in cell wall biosynthesis